jgi:aldehyde dehydrogenase (NAD+)
MARMAAVDLSPLAARGSDIDRIYNLQRANRLRVGASSADERIAKIRRILDAVMKRRPEIRRAMWDDFRKPAAEVDLIEVYAVTTEAKHAIRNLRSWMQPKRVATPIQLIGSSSRIMYEPKGLALILSPWNFPLNLTFGPLVSAIAAGNCVVMKPSELTPHTSALMKQITADLFDESEVAVIEGDGTVASELLERAWDHIFFTGSPRVGKLVMRAAAEHLTPVTLELGGKSPVIVDRSANLDDAAKKIAWGKFLNAGQVCIAPDYLFLDEAVADAFLAKLRTAVERLGGQAHRPVVVTERHAQRVEKLVADSVATGASVLLGGNRDGRSLPATVLTGVSATMPVMQEEIFGPVLPVMTYRDRADVYRFVAENEKPLALYIFSRDRRVIDEVLANTTAGGSAINHIGLHFFQPYLPFGGVGNSGVGKGHGFFGFEAFSNARAIYDQSTPFNAMSLLMPPYSAFKQKLIDLTLRWF